MLLFFLRSSHERFLSLLRYLLDHSPTNTYQFLPLKIPSRADFSLDFFLSILCRKRVHFLISVTPVNFVPMVNPRPPINLIWKHFSISLPCKFELISVSIPFFSLFFLFTPRQPRVQNHLKNVYTCLLAATFCATLGVYLSMLGWLNYPRLAIFASIITSVWLFSIEFNARTQKQCFGLMAATALFTGIYLSPLINLAIQVDPQIVMTAFLLTTVVFVCFTLSALFTQKRTYLYLGGRVKHEQRFGVTEIFRYIGNGHIGHVFIEFNEPIRTFTTGF